MKNMIDIIININFVIYINNSIILLCNLNKLYNKNYINKFNKLLFIHINKSHNKNTN